MKFPTALTLSLTLYLCLTACDAPGVRAEKARDDVVAAERKLDVAKVDAAKRVADAHTEATEAVDQARADLDVARDDLKKRLDQVDADLAALEREATTAEEKAELAALRVRQEIIVTRVREHQYDDRGWVEVREDVGRALEELDNDARTVRTRRSGSRPR